ncbi:hypothetical protein B2J93_1279 [Marssonina coronariae]|uniref:Uncharacterized protein n=1 Tax=Diplocarpon coronariae TaxID=2795749 RepID=A0A218Z2R4_9HELO|nr:hypothetical protein B2J93_1279 [Marssonina coronariae]
MVSYHQTPKLIRFDPISQSELELQHAARGIATLGNALCAFYGDYDRELIQGPVKIAMAEMLDNVSSKVEACSQMARKKFYKSIDEQYAMNLTVFEQTESGWRAKLASEITVLQAGEEEVEEQYQNDHEVDMGGTLAIRTLEALKSLDKIHLVELQIDKVIAALERFRAEKEYINKRQTKADNKFTRLEIASAQFGRDEMIGISKSVHANKVYDAEVSDKKLNKKIRTDDKEDHDEGFFQPPIPPRSLHKQARSLKE